MTAVGGARSHDKKGTPVVHDTTLLLRVSIYRVYISARRRAVHTEVCRDLSQALQAKADVVYNFTACLETSCLLYLNVFRLHLHFSFLTYSRV